jgi:hypothetical protein
VNEIVFLLEEASAKAMLEGLLPRLLPENITVRYIVFEGKQDLEKQMVHRLRHYNVPGARFLVLRDQDASDCHIIKKGLTEKCKEAGKAETLIRIACHELESWYLADLAAVESGMEIDGLAVRQSRKKYRMPDDCANAAEELVKLTKHKHLYQKVGGSRAIGPYLDINNIRSQSFSVFIAGIKKLIAPTYLNHRGK